MTGNNVTVDLGGFSSSIKTKEREICGLLSPAVRNLRKIPSKKQQLQRKVLEYF